MTLSDRSELFRVGRMSTTTVTSSTPLFSSVISRMSKTAAILSHKIRGSRGTNIGTQNLEHAGRSILILTILYMLQEQALKEDFIFIWIHFRKSTLKILKVLDSDCLLDIRVVSLIWRTRSSFWRQDSNTTSPFRNTSSNEQIRSITVPV